MKKHLLRICGFLALGIGFIGIFVPLLPTTPLVLLAAVCFSSSSPVMYQKLEQSKMFGPYIENHRSGAGVPLAAKVRALIFLWSFLVLSAVLSGKPFLWAVLLLVGTAVTVHISRLKTRKAPIETKEAAQPAPEKHPDPRV